MSFTIIFYKDRREVTRELFAGHLHEADSYAGRLLGSPLVDAAEIRNHDGTPILRRPREKRFAEGLFPDDDFDQDAALSEYRWSLIEAAGVSRPPAYTWQ